MAMALRYVHDVVRDVEECRGVELVCFVYARQKSLRVTCCAFIDRPYADKCSGYFLKVRLHLLLCKSDGK